MVDNSDWHDHSVFDYWIIVDRLADVILYYVKGCVVEIGLGRSTKVLAKHAREAGVKHYAVDISERRCEAVSKDKEIAHDGLVIFRGSSAKFMKDFDDTPALVFIDGSHKSRVVRAEAKFFLDKLLPGGIIFFHDMYYCEEWGIRFKEIGKGSDCYKVRWELENMKDIWCLTFPYTASACGLTMVMKRPEFEYTADPLDLVGSFEDQRMSGKERVVYFGSEGFRGSRK
jgi:hypothetical protein